MSTFDYSFNFIVVGEASIFYLFFQVLEKLVYYYNLQKINFKIITQLLQVQILVQKQLKIMEK